MGDTLINTLSPQALNLDVSEMLSPRSLPPLLSWQRGLQGRAKPDFAKAAPFPSC